MGQTGVAHAGPDFLHPARQHLATRLGHRAVKTEVVATHFDRTGDPDLVAQAGNGNLARVVDHRYRRRPLGPHYREGGAIAFARVNRQVHAHAAQQGRAKGAAGDHYRIGS